MSVNYFAKRGCTHPGCEVLHLNETVEGSTNGELGLHVGKSSGGWDFLWRGHEDLNLVSRARWEDWLRQPGVIIVAEHGIEYTPREFLETIVDDKLAKAVIQHARYWLRHSRDSLDNSLNVTCWVDEDGHPFCGTEFC